MVARSSPADTREIPGLSTGGGSLVASASAPYVRGPIQKEVAMHRRTLVRALAVATVGSAVLAGSAGAAAPTDQVSDSYTVRFHDPLCGVDQWTTLTERWTWTEFADGSATLQVVRSFVPDDPRLPVEKGSGVNHISADGTETVTGAPLRLFWPESTGKHGVMVVAAGRAVFSEAGATFRGTNPDLSDEALDRYYCSEVW
jgi:hypothetical protein